MVEGFRAAVAGPGQHPVVVDEVIRRTACPRSRNRDQGRMPAGGEQRLRQSLGWHLPPTTARSAKAAVFGSLFQHFMG